MKASAISSLARRLMCGSIVLAASVVGLVGCADDKPKRTAAVDAAPQKIDAPHLPNAYRLHAKVISGGQPDGEAAFRELRDLGVKTVISVDGARPEVELAKQYGMRYVHLPHGYDGVPEQRARELAKAVRDLDGPIYIHCHHGKHRSPAAATVACVATGLLPSTAAIGMLKTAGTSPHYRGLYQSAESARRLDNALLDQLEANFPETADLTALAESMVATEHIHDHLKAFAAAEWKVLAKQPDLDPAHEALLLREAFAEMLRLEEVAQQPERFRQLMHDGETAAGGLESALRDWIASGRPSDGRSSINQSLTRVNANCQACHNEFRDVPLGEKGRH